MRSVRRQGHFLYSPTRAYIKVTFIVLVDGDRLVICLVSSSKLFGEQILSFKAESKTTAVRAHSEMGSPGLKVQLCHFQADDFVKGI